MTTTKELPIHHCFNEPETCTMRSGVLCYKQSTYLVTNIGGLPPVHRNPSVMSAMLKSLSIISTMLKGPSIKTRTRSLCNLINKIKNSLWLQQKHYSSSVGLISHKLTPWYLRCCVTSSLLTSSLTLVPCLLYIEVVVLYLLCLKALALYLLCLKVLVL